MSLDRVPMGSFCFLALVTSDPEEASRFYHDLFGWSLRHEYGVPMLHRGDELVCSIVDRSQDERSRGQPSNWMPFIRVEDPDAVIERAKQLGGRMYSPTLDMLVAQTALIRGPTREIVGLWQTPVGDRPAVLTDPEVTAWFELVTPEPERAIPFYRDLFGWRFTNEGSYTVLTNGATPLGGVVRLSGDWEDHAFLSAIGQAPGEKWDVPPHWMPFFKVDDCDETLRRAESLGGRVNRRTDYLHTFGRFGVFCDPQGTYVSILSRG